MKLATAVTLLRIVLIPFIVYLLFVDPFAAGVLFLLAALTDWLDGFVARKLNQASDLGAFLDPLADKILVLSVLVVLVELGKVTALPVIIILIRELTVMGLRIMAAGKGISVPAEKLSKLKTVVQVLAVLALMWGMTAGTVLLWLAVILTLISGAGYLWILKA